MGSHSVTFHPTQVNSPRLASAIQDGTRFTYPGWIEGWVDLGDLLHTEMVYPPVDGHPSKYWPGPVSINDVDRTQRTNHYTTPPPATSVNDLAAVAMQLADWR